MRQNKANGPAPAWRGRQGLSPPEDSGEFVRPGRVGAGSGDGDGGHGGGLGEDSGQGSRVFEDSTAESIFAPVIMDAAHCDFAPHGPHSMTIGVGGYVVACVGDGG